nr:hypothetical protein HAGR004_18390 [Bdellovibrio sp. HAGR004]
MVAEAVRGLSQRSATSAREIAQLISQSAVKTGQGARLASSSHKVMGQVFDAIEKLAAVNSEIAVTSREQAQGLAQISTATTHWIQPRRPMQLPPKKHQPRQRISMRKAKSCADWWRC